MGSTDSFDPSAPNGGAATARSDRHLQRELSDLKQQFQFAALQHREDVNIMRSKLMEMQQQLSQATASRDEAYEAIVNERAVAALRVQESEAAHRDAVKMMQQTREKLQAEEQRGRDLMRSLDATLHDLERYKLQNDSLEHQQRLHSQSLQQYEQQQLDSKRLVATAEEAQQQLKQQVQTLHQQLQQQMDSSQSQFHQQLHTIQKELSAAQHALTESERSRSSAEARANRCN
jgi:chromosome segregation ATPase